MLRIGICDDSAEARQYMLQLCQKYYENNTDAFEYQMYKNAEEVLEYCNDEENQKIDILFLDIEMPDMSGLDFLESAQNTPKVIITSAYERYALRGYEFDVVDYLLKPISFSRFLKSVNKAHALMESTSKSEEPAYIFVKTEKQLKRLYLKEIQFIEGMENYIVIHTLTSKEIVHLRLKSILETLPAQIFMQVHRSFIVNLSYVQAIEGNLLILSLIHI